MTRKKLSEVYYQPYHLWKGSKGIREVHKIMPIPKKDVKSWLAKQALWQFHVQPSKKNHPYYEVTNPN